MTLWIIGRRRNLWWTSLVQGPHQHLESDETIEVNSGKPGPSEAGHSGTWRLTAEAAGKRGKSWHVSFSVARMWLRSPHKSLPQCLCASLHLIMAFQRGMTVMVLPVHQQNAQGNYSQQTHFPRRAASASDISTILNESQWISMIHHTSSTQLELWQIKVIGCHGASIFNEAWPSPRWWHLAMWLEPALQGLAPRCNLTWTVLIFAGRRCDIFLYPFPHPSCKKWNHLTEAFVNCIS